MFSALFNLIFPRYCAYCEAYLKRSEQIVCASCLEKAPFRSSNFENELLKETLQCFFRVEKAYSLLFFKSQNFTSQLIHDLKYHNKPEIGVFLGEKLGEKLPQDFDWIIPVPLHPKRLKERGYNQSECIAKGISNILKIPVNTTSLHRTVNNPKQAHTQSTEERLQNVLNIFSVENVAEFEGKHILIIDDVITSGSTIYQAVFPFLQLKDIKISVACLSYAR